MGRLIRSNYKAPVYRRKKKPDNPKAYPANADALVSIIH
jgi:hypothetical protein